MTDFTDFSDLKGDVSHRMQKAIDLLRQEFSGLRTGRASPALLDSIMVDAYGSPTPLHQVASISVPEARLLTVSVWDKTLVEKVEKAIRDSDLGLNPASEGQLLRLPIPPRTEERRLDMTKVAGRYSEQARVAVRNVRRDGMDHLKRQEKDKHISEDEQKMHADELQKLTDEMIKTIDDLLESKTKEIMQV